MSPGFRKFVFARGNVKVKTLPGVLRTKREALERDCSIVIDCRHSINILSKICWRDSVEIVGRESDMVDIDELVGRPECPRVVQSIGHLRRYLSYAGDPI